MQRFFRLKGVRVVFVLLVTIGIIGASFAGGVLVERRRFAALEQFVPLFEAGSLVKQHFLFELPADEEFIDGAIEGMLEKLDEEHTYYLNPRDARNTAGSWGGAFGGIGVGFTTENEQYVVTYVMDDLPAEKAGVKAGDIITHVDGKTVRGIRSDIFVSMVRGEIGTEVTLTVYRLDERGLLDITIIRDLVDVEEVYTDILAEGRIGYIRLTFFSGDSPAAIREALQQLIEVDHVEGLILDLRGNLGGDFGVTLGILSEFLPGGEVVCQTREVGGTYTHVTAPNYRGLATEIPLVVLIDQGSASGSELFVAAIKDHGRGTLIGTATLGKGVGGTKFNLSNGGWLIITRFEFLSPKGRTINKVGIQPDEGFFIPNTPAQRARGRDPVLDEAVEVLSEQIDSASSP